MSLDVSIGEHLYTTDFFQMSAFNSEHQIISIYYFVTALEEIAVPLRTKKFDFDDAQMKIYQQTGEIETFRFIKWEDVSEEEVTLPIDKHVVKLLMERFNNPA
jgi:hypothetical protein